MNHLLGAIDVYLGIGAGVALVLVLLVSVKLYREGRQMDELAKDETAGEYLNNFYHAHPEARPLSKRFVLVVFVVLACAAAVMFIASRS